jgi:hypothetical protein
LAGFYRIRGHDFHQSVIENEDDRSRIRAALLKLSCRKEVEQSFNQFMLPDDLFSEGASKTSDEEILHLAERIAEMWEARLACVFPDKKCVVELQLPEETQEGPTIVVYQARETNLRKFDFARITPGYYKPTIDEEEWPSGIVLVASAGLYGIRRIHRPWASIGYLSSL